MEDQRSIDKLQEVSIGPASETIMKQEHLTNIINRLESGLSKSLKKIKSDQVKELLTQNIGWELEQLRNGQQPQQIYKYLSFAYDEAASLLDYLPEDGIFFLDELGRVQEMGESLDKEEADWYTSLLQAGEIVHDATVSHNLSKLLASTSLPKVYFSLFLRHIPNTSPQNIFNLSSKPMQSFHGQMNVLKAELDRWKKGNFTIILLGPDEEQNEEASKGLK